MLAQRDSLCVIRRNRCRRTARPQQALGRKRPACVPTIPAGCSTNVSSLV